MSKARYRVGTVLARVRPAASSVSHPDCLTKGLLVTRTFQP